MNNNDGNDYVNVGDEDSLTSNPHVDFPESPTLDPETGQPVEFPPPLPPLDPTLITTKTTWETMLENEQEEIRLAQELEDFMLNRFESKRYVWGVKNSIHAVDPVQRGLVVIVTCNMSNNNPESENETGDEARAVRFSERIKQELGETVEVERRTMGSKDDQLFEVWIESYEHILLFSRRSSVFNKEWDGKRVMDDEEEDRIIENIKFQVSDEARHGYVLEDVTV